MDEAEEQLIRDINSHVGGVLHFGRDAGTGSHRKESCKCRAWRITSAVFPSTFDKDPVVALACLECGGRSNFYTCPLSEHARVQDADRRDFISGVDGVL